MSLIPIQKAFDASNRSSAYIFFCVHRKFPVIIQYNSLKLLAEINNVYSVSSLLTRHDFDDFECGVYEERAIGQLFWYRGYRVSEVSRLTEIQPLEVAMYYSGLVSADEETMRIILERTGNLDITIEHLNFVYGEAVYSLANK